MLIIGSICFGLVIGWVTYRTLRRSQTNGLSDIATVIGSVGGAAVTTLFPSGTEVFSGYCIGLAIGFFAYLTVAAIVDVRAVKSEGMKKVSIWLGGNPGETTTTITPEISNPGS